MDRSVRPLFRKDYTNSTQVICTVLSYDPQHDALPVALNAVSACLHARAKDFGFECHGPVAAVRVGLDPDSGEYVVNPPPAEVPEMDLNALVVLRENGRVVMLEAGARQVSDETFLGAVELAREHSAPTFAFQQRYVLQYLRRWSCSWSWSIWIGFVV